MLLAGQIKDNNRNHRQDQSRHNRAHIHASVASLHILNCNGYRFIFVQIQYKIWKQEIIPYPHCLQNSHGNISGLHNRKHHIEKCAERCTAVDHCRFLNFQRNGLHKTAEHKNRQSGSKSQIYNHNSPRSIQPGPVRHQRKCKHNHLKRHNHRKYTQQI